jgi:hypothetical protein
MNGEKKMCKKVECPICGRVAFTEWCGRQFSSNHDVVIESCLCDYCQDYNKRNNLKTFADVIEFKKLELE